MVRRIVPYHTFLQASAVLLALSSTQAQYFQPIATYGASCISQEGKYMLVSGGHNGTGAIGQTFSLDLSTPWETSNPKFSKLALGPLDYQITNVLLNDNIHWLLISNGNSYQYDIVRDTWLTVASLPNLYDTSQWAIQGQVDPATGLVYVPNGYVVGNTTTMMEYNIAQGSTKGLPMPLGLTGIDGFTVAWSGRLKRMLVHGGSSQVIARGLDTLYAFDPSSKTWSQLFPKGDIPPARVNHCMVPAFGGAKIVVFGGFNYGHTVAYSDIYILDIDTLVWTKGQDAGPANARALASCSAANDLFIAWSGRGVANGVTVTNNVTMIYNLRTSAWQTTFSPTPLSPSGGTGPNGEGPSYLPGKTGDGEGEKKSSNMGGIIGGVIGGLVVIGLVVGAFMYRRKKQRGDGAKYSVAEAALPSPGMKDVKNHPWYGGNGGPPDSAQYEELLQQQQILIQQQQLQQQDQLIQHQQYQLQQHQFFNQEQHHARPSVSIPGTPSYAPSEAWTSAGGSGSSPGQSHGQSASIYSPAMTAHSTSLYSPPPATSSGYSPPVIFDPSRLNVGIATTTATYPEPPRQAAVGGGGASGEVRGPQVYDPSSQ